MCCNEPYLWGPQPTVHGAQKMHCQQGQMPGDILLGAAADGKGFTEYLAGGFNVVADISIDGHLQMNITEIYE